jgi:hypothetical protein
VERHSQGGLGLNRAVEPREKKKKILYILRRETQEPTHTSTRLLKYKVITNYAIYYINLLVSSHTRMKHTSLKKVTQKVFFLAVTRNDVSLISEAITFLSICLCNRSHHL